jgi:hypothetical protein
MCDMYFYVYIYRSAIKEEKITGQRMCVRMYMHMCIYMCLCRFIMSLAFQEHARAQLALLHHYRLQTVLYNSLYPYSIILIVIRFSSYNHKYSYFARR